MNLWQMLPNRLAEIMGTHEHAAGRSPHDVRHMLQRPWQNLKEHISLQQVGWGSYWCARLQGLACRSIEATLSSAEGCLCQCMGRISLQQSQFAWASTQTVCQRLASPPQDVQTCSRWVASVESTLACGLLCKLFMPQGSLDTSSAEGVPMHPWAKESLHSM